MKYFFGLDLGQSQDYTACAILERIPGTGGAQARYHGVHLERLALGTPYPAVVAHVAGLLATPELRGRTALVVDATGVGRPVVDMLRQAKLAPVAVTITGGDTTSHDGSGHRVPKRDLVSVVQVLLQSERLKFAEALPAVPALVQELLAFRVKITAAAHDTYGAWREGAHDDLVLATAVAAWYGERPQPPPPVFWASRSYFVWG